MSLKNLQDKILAICKNSAEALGDKDIAEKLGAKTNPSDRMKVYNKLLKTGMLVLIKKPGGTGTLFQWLDEKDAAKFRGLSASDRLVYQTIKQCGADGASLLSIRNITGINRRPEVKKIVGVLLERQLVKQLKSVEGGAKNKIVYVLFELKASTKVTGGVWYNEDGELDGEFIEGISIVVQRFIESKTFVTVDEVASYLGQIKISNDALSASNANELMRSILFKGTIEECKGPEEGVVYYRKTQPTHSQASMSTIPCTMCPIFNQCHPGGIVSPATCEYMDEWLKQAEDW